MRSVLLMRVVKSVSLPVVLAEKAEQLPNFSVFVQDCLAYGLEEGIEKITKQRDYYKRKFNEEFEVVEEIVELYSEKRRFKEFYEKVTNILKKAGWLE